MNSKNNTQTNKSQNNLKREWLIWSVLSNQFLMTIKPNTLMRLKPQLMITTVHGLTNIFVFSREIGSINSDNLLMLFWKWFNPYFLLLSPLFFTLMKLDHKSVTFKTLEVSSSSLLWMLVFHMFFHQSIFSILKGPSSFVKDLVTLIKHRLTFGEDQVLFYLSKSLLLWFSLLFAISLSTSIILLKLGC